MSRKIIEVTFRREDDDYGLKKLAQRIMDLIQEQDFAEIVPADNRNKKGHENEMNLNEAFPSRYLKATDLNGRTRNVIIKDVTMEEVGQAKDRRFVAYFRGEDAKGLVLNKTNAKRIANIAGSQDTDDWVGTKVALKAEMVDFKGDAVLSIRVNMPDASAQPEPMPRDTSDDDEREPGWDD